MGYETRMYVVQEISAHPDWDPAPQWGKVIAMVDLCKTGHYGAVTEAITKGKPDKPEIFIYADDGNTKIVEDRYGEYLGVHDPKEMLELMKEANKYQPYRRYRYAMAIAILEVAIESFPGEDLKVVTYGY